MKKSIIPFVATATFLSLAIIAYAGKPVNKDGMPFGYGFPSGYHYNLNTLGRQYNLICPQLKYVDGTHVHGNVIFIPHDHGNDHIPNLNDPDLCHVNNETGNHLVLLDLVDRSGRATFSSLKRTNTKAHV